MAKRIEVSVSFQAPSDLVLDMSEEEYEEFLEEDDYQILWEWFEDRITDWLASWTTIDYAEKTGSYEEEEED